MSKIRKILIILVVVIFLGVVIFFVQKEYFSNSREEPLSDVDSWYKKDILGNKDDLISFSILPNTKVQGVVPYRGMITGGYFFEGNILVNVTDINKNIILKGNAMATTEWMTERPVNFEGNIDFSLLPKGGAYIEIHNDNASGLPENDKSVLIPIIIE